MSLPDLRSRLRPTNTAFFLDVDGTLLGFKDDPNDVVADDDLRTTLRDLATAAGGAVALVSGRTIADLDRIVAPLVLPAGGTHGVELRFADGRRETTTVDLREPRVRLMAFAASRPGLTIEDKGNAIAIHYRRAPERADEVISFLADFASGGEFAVQHGKCVAEVKSRSIGKGQAIAALMETPPFANRRAMFVGDDLTDEHGFAFVNSADGISVKVGEGETIAHYRIADPQAVRDLLKQSCCQY